MLKRKATLYFLLLLLFHAAHVFEEIYGRFFVIDRFYGLGWFLLLNWILLVIPFYFFYNFLSDRRWAQYLALVYSYFMILNGSGHIMMTLVTGKYFDGFAGGFSGIGLIAAGSFLQHYLRKLIKENIASKLQN